MDKILLFLSCIIAVVADMLFVWWAKKPDHPLWCIITAVLLNTIGIIIWTYTLRKGIEAPLAITFYALFTVAGCSFLGYYFFGDHLSNTNAVGLVLALIALVLISL